MQETNGLMSRNSPGPVTDLGHVEYFKHVGFKSLDFTN